MLADRTKTPIGKIALYRTLEGIWARSAMKVPDTFAARWRGLRIALALEIECHCSADEILEGRLIDVVAFVDVDGAPDVPVEAGVE